MPVVPQRVLRPTNQTVRGGGANLQPLFQGGKELGAGLEKAQEKQQQYDLNRLETEYLTERRKLLYGDGGQETLQGEAYVNQMPQTEQALNDLRQRFVEQVPDDENREIFDLWATDRNLRDLESMDQRGVKHKTTADIQLQQTRAMEYKQNNVDSGGLDWEENADHIVTSVKERLELEGIQNKEVIDSIIEAEISDMHRITVEKLLATGQADDVANAQAYFLEVRGMIDADVARDLEGKLSESNSVATAFAAVDAVLQRRRVEDLSPSEMRAAVDDSLQDDPKARKEALLILNNRLSREAQDQKRERDAARTKASEFLYANPGTTTSDFRRADPDTWEVLSGEENALVNLDQLAANIAKGRKWSNTDTGEFDKVMELPEESNDFVSYDVDANAHLFTEQQGTQIKKAQEAERSRREGLITDDKIFRDVETDIRRRVGDELRVGEQKQKEWQAERFRSINRVMRAWVQGFVDAGTVPTFEERQERLEELLVERPFREGLFEDGRLNPFTQDDQPFLTPDIEAERLDKTARNFEQMVKKGEFDDLDIEPDLRGKYVQLLTQRGIDPNSETILDLYKAEKILEDREAFQQILENPTRPPETPGVSMEGVMRTIEANRVNIRPHPLAKSPGRLPGTNVPSRKPKAKKDPEKFETPPPPEVPKAADEANFDDYAVKLFEIEAGNNSNAVSPTGAAGPYQFIKGTWLSLVRQGLIPSVDPGLSREEKLDMRFNPKAAKEGLAALTKQHESAILARGLEPNFLNLYILHNLGQTQGIRLAQAGDDVRLRDIMRASDRKHNPKFYLNGAVTVGDAKQRIMEELEQVKKPPVPRPKPTR